MQPRRRHLHVGPRRDAPVRTSVRRECSLSHELRHVSPLPPLAISGNDSTFATRLQPLQVGLFSLETLRRQQAFTVGAGHASAITSLAWSPRSALLAVAQTNDRVELWSVAGRPHLARAFIRACRARRSNSACQSEASRSVPTAPSSRPSDSGTLQGLHRRSDSPPSGGRATGRCYGRNLGRKDPLTRSRFSTRRKTPRPELRAVVLECRRRPSRQRTLRSTPSRRSDRSDRARASRSPQTARSRPAPGKAFFNSGADRPRRRYSGRCSQCLHRWRASRSIPAATRSPAAVPADSFQALGHEDLAAGGHRVPGLHRGSGRTRSSPPAARTC